MQEEQRVRVIKPQQFDANTPQTPGMQRVAAVSKQLAGAQGLWAGVTVVAPNVASSVHHHGETETVIYVVSGHAKIRWGDRMQFEEDVEAGDFIYVPPSFCASSGDQSIARHSLTMGNCPQFTGTGRCKPSAVRRSIAMVCIPHALVYTCDEN